MEPKIAYSWKPVEDLPDSLKVPAGGEWKGLAEYWADQRRDADERGVLDQVMVRLKREWAIETGAIEGVYTLDRGVTTTLIEKGIEAALIPHGSSDKSPEWVAQVIRDQQEVLDHLFDFVASRRELSESYVKEIHVALMRNQDTRHAIDTLGHMIELPLSRGVYKQMPNNPQRTDRRIHEYCPPIHVSSEMERLIEIHRQHAKQNLSPEVQAAWLHHAFSQIHPFEDGNGRVCRALATLVLLRGGGFPFTVRVQERLRYLDALEEADAGDLRSLISLVMASQRSAAFFLASALGEAVPANGKNGRARTVDEALAAVKAELRTKGLIVPDPWLSAKQYAERLLALAQERFKRLKKQLTEQLGSRAQRFKFSDFSEEADDTRVGLLPLTSSKDFRRQCGIQIDGPGAGRVYLTFASVGAPRFRGLVAVGAFWNNERLPVDLFQMNYREPFDSIKERFAEWLEPAIVAGLNKWRAEL